MEQLALRVRLRDWARFDTFVAGPNVAALEALADTGPAAPRVVWLWGRAGTGKTHLLQAACAAAGATGATAYIDLRDTTEPERLEGCETLTTVCLDSLEVVAGDPGWNAALFRLYTLMQDLRGRLIVASRAAPASIAFRLPDLRSRLLAADSWQLQELDDPGQVRALQLRAERRGLTLADDAALFLVHRLPRDMHSLCRVLDQLDEASLVAQRRLTMPFLRQALAAQVDAAGSADD
jgi:DnaA family protein